MGWFDWQMENWLSPETSTERATERAYKQVGPLEKTWQEEVKGPSSSPGALHKAATVKALRKAREQLGPAATKDAIKALTKKIRDGLTSQIPTNAPEIIAKAEEEGAGALPRPPDQPGERTSPSFASKLMWGFTFPDRFVAGVAAEGSRAQQELAEQMGPPVEGETTTYGVPQERLREYSFENPLKSITEVIPRALKGGWEAGQKDVMHAPMAERITEIKRNNLKRGVLDARAQLGSGADKEMIKELATQIANKYNKQDSMSWALEHPVAAEMVTEIFGNPLTYIGGAVSKLPKALGAGPKLLKAGKVAKNVAEGAVVGGFAGEGILDSAETGAGIGGAAAAALSALPAGKQVAKGFKKHFKYGAHLEPLEQAGKISAAERALLAADKAAKWGEGELVKQGAKVSDELKNLRSKLKKVPKESRKVFKEEYLEVLQENDELFRKDLPKRMAEREKNDLFRILEDEKLIVDANVTQIQRVKGAAIASKALDAKKVLLEKVHGVEFVPYKSRRSGRKAASLIPKPFADQLDALENKAGALPGIVQKWTRNKVVRNYYRPLLKAWRQLVTGGGFMGFASKNAISAGMLAMKNGGWAAGNPANLAKAALGAFLGTSGNKKFLKFMEKMPAKALEDGSKMTMKEAWDIFEVAGMGGQLEQHLGVEALQDVVNMVPGKKNIVEKGMAAAPKAVESIMNFGGAKGIRHLSPGFINRASENFQHFVTFLGFLKGKDEKSIAHAVQLASKASGNYRRLTPFEKNAMNDVLGFYSWMRFAGPDFVKSLTEKPGFMTNVVRGQKAAQLSMEPEVQLGWEELPEWQRDFSTVIKKLGPDRFATLMVEQPWKWGSEVMKGVGDLGQQFTPAIQFMLQALTKRDLRYGSEITLGENVERSFGGFARPSKPFMDLIKLYEDNGLMGKAEQMKLMLEVARYFTPAQAYQVESATENLVETKREAIEKAKKKLRFK